MNYEDINKSEMYKPEWDALIFQIIKEEHASCACIQRVLTCGYPLADRTRNEFIKFGYCEDKTKHFKTIITEKEFEEIISKRKVNEEKQDGNGK